MMSRSEAVQNHLERLLYTQKGKIRIRSMRRNIAIARSVVLLGHGWPINLNDTTIQIGLNTTFDVNDQKVFTPVYEEWQGRVAQPHFLG